MDLFSGHGITVTRFSDSLWFTAGYSYTTLQNDLSGSRIFGTQFDSAFGEPVPTLGQRDHAFIDLAGTAQVKENLFNANLFWMPLETPHYFDGFPIHPRELGHRFDFSGGGTRAEHAAVYPNESGSMDSTMDLRNRIWARTADYNLFAQRLELRYTGIKDWLFYAEGEWEEEYGHVNENQNIDEDVPLDKNTDALGQKYTIGCQLEPDDETKSVRAGPSQNCVL